MGEREATIVGYLHRNPDSVHYGVCVPCYVASERGAGYTIPIYEGATHTGQFDDDPVEVAIPVEYSCDYCGDEVSA